MGLRVALPRLKGRSRPEDALREIDLVRYEIFRACLYPIGHYALGRTRDSDAH